MQLITPDPNIPCRPGWCLQYVREAFGLPARHPSATAAWEASTSKHPDRNFPPGCWVPVWYAVAGEPLGHVVLLAPDGSCYSTSTLATTPYHHPSLAHLEAFYTYYGMALTYRGWTEDVAGYPVLAPGGLAAMGSTTTTQKENDDLSAQFETDARGEFDGLRLFQADVRGEFDKVRALDADVRADLANKGRQITALTSTVDTLAGLVRTGDTVTAEEVRDAVAAAIADGLTLTVTGGRP